VKGEVDDLIVVEKEGTAPSNPKKARKIVRE
jgi:hypothetical protein